jgi:hypothetical protein
MKEEQTLGMQIAEAAKDQIFNSLALWIDRDLLKTDFFDKGEPDKLACLAGGPVRIVVRLEAYAELDAMDGPLDHVAIDSLDKEFRLDFIEDDRGAISMEVGYLSPVKARRQLRKALPQGEDDV